MPCETLGCPKFEGSCACQSPEGISLTQVVKTLAAILVDNAKIASQKLGRNQPGQFWDATYAIPNELTRGKASVMVKLQAQPGNFAGGLFGCRVLRQE